jgi:hypothetical protein
VADARVKAIIAANERGAPLPWPTLCGRPPHPKRPVRTRLPAAPIRRRRLNGRPLCARAMADATRPRPRPPHRPPLPLGCRHAVAPPLTGSALVLGTIALSLATRSMNVLDTRSPTGRSPRSPATSCLARSGHLGDHSRSASPTRYRRR